MTRAEKTLAERGERDAIEHIRRRFQQQMAEEFTSVVEQATGRKVRVCSCGRLRGTVEVEHLGVIAAPTAAGTPYRPAGP